MSPRFEAPCPDCLEPIEYVASRPATHDCVTEYREEESVENPTIISVNEVE